MKRNIVLLSLLFIITIVLALTNQTVRHYIFAQQQQGLLQFEQRSPTSVPIDSTLTFSQELSTGTQQVDWVFDNQGRCWNAWSAPSCGLQQHEGGVSVPSMRDLDQDGSEDITCSQSETINGTTITNTSNKTITINCEKYTCAACVSGNGMHAQCDGGTDKNAKRVVETVELAPGCVATCTMTGVYGSCLPNKEPPQITDTPAVSNTPAITNTIVPTSKPSSATTLTPTKIISPTSQPTTITLSPTTIPTTVISPTVQSSPTIRPSATHLPLALDYGSYVESYNQYPPTYVYAMLNRSYNSQNTQRAITGLSNINGNVIKIIMISEFNALEQILTNHFDQIQAANITWIGYNAERDGRTPQAELDAIFSANSSTNTINKMGTLTDQYGLKLMLGPVTPMWNEYFNRQDKDAVARAMIGDKCYLDGVAFQEQKQISRTNKAERAQVVGERTAFFRNHAQACPQFESMVQIMSSWCKQNASWEECRGYSHLLNNLQGPSRINSLAIWASGDERNDLPNFIQFLRN